MRRGVVSLALSAAAVLLTGAEWRRGSAERGREAFLAREAVRLRSHFDSVDRELRARDVSALTPAQREARSRLIAWLRDYRDAGRYPENDRFAVATPFFRDTRGTLCAMAYLIDRSGRGDFVDRVAASRNNAYIRELANDPTLVAWLDSTGLDVAEAARIQPYYGPPPGSVDDSRTADAGYALSSLIVSGASLATAAVNVVKPRFTGAMLGLLAGGSTVALGATRLDEHGGTKRLAVANTVVGAAALAAGVRALIVSRRPTGTQSARRDAGGGVGDLLREATVAPGVFRTAEGGSRLGLTLNATF